MGEYRSQSYRLNGVGCGLLMHSSIAVDPSSPLARAKSAISGKRKKTDTDYALLGDLDWVSGIYATEPVEFSVSSTGIEVSCSGVPCITADCLLGAIEGAARVHRKGKDIKCGAIIEDDSPLIYDGPKDLSALIRDHNFRDMRPVNIERKKIMRVRPRFKSWSAEVRVDFLPDIIDGKEITELFALAGTRIGICDFRPRFGRFSVTEI